jgi:hypothetical protein
MQESNTCCFCVACDINLLDDMPSKELGLEVIVESLSI